MSSYDINHVPEHSMRSHQFQKILWHHPHQLEGLVGWFLKGNNSSSLKCKVIFIFYIIRALLSPGEKSFLFSPVNLYPILASLIFCYQQIIIQVSQSSSWILVSYFNLNTNIPLHLHRHQLAYTSFIFTSTLLNQTLLFLLYSSYTAIRTQTIFSSF